MQLKKNVILIYFLFLIHQITFTQNVNEAKKLAQLDTFFATHLPNFYNLDPFEKFFVIGVVVEHKNDKPNGLQQLETITTKSNNKQDAVYLDFMKKLVAVSYSPQNISFKQLFMIIT